MIKICHITSAHKRHDIRIFAKECVTLAANNYMVDLIVADGFSNETSNQVNILSITPAKTRLKRILFTPGKIYQKVLQLEPDIVHFHDPELIFIGLKLQKLGFKVIYDVHEDVPKQVMSKYWLPKLARPLISKMVTLIEKYAAKRFTGVVAATPIIAQRFLRYNHNTTSICNYPLLSELDSNLYRWEERQNTLCYIGSISLSRGIKTIVESLAMSNAKLKLAGLFSGDISLAELVTLPGGKFIDYMGVLNRQEIAALLSKVKVGLVTLYPTPSYIESLPIKMFEYMLAGIPIVASDFPLWESIIKQYKCGILVNPENPKQIAEACLWLFANQNEARVMGENGRIAVLQYFNWETEANKLLAFYTLISNAADK